MQPPNNVRPCEASANIHEFLEEMGCRGQLCSLALDQAPARGRTLMEAQLVSSVIYSGASDLIQLVEKDGMFVVKNFFNRDAVIAARGEIEQLLDDDDRRREAENLPPVDARTPLRTIKTKLMHNIWFPVLRSPAFCRLVNDMFDSEVIREFMQALVGTARLRIDLARRATGANDYVDDFQLPHEWHRDTPGEFTFGIFLDDMTTPNSGGTCCIRGTHKDELDPRWDLMLGEGGNRTRKEYLGNRNLISLSKEESADAVLNKQVREACRPKIVELLGEMGDMYFFLNETWHGRAANTTGKKFMLSRIGGFATDFPFKDDISLPDMMTDLPEPLRTLYSRTPEINTNLNTLMRRLYDNPRLVPETIAAAKEKTAILDRILHQRRSSAEL